MDAIEELTNLRDVILSSVERLAKDELVFDNAEELQRRMEIVREIEDSIKDLRAGWENGNG